MAQASGIPARGEVAYLDVPPVLLGYVAPDYPPAARAAGLEGTVWLTCRINGEGEVISASPVSGWHDPNFETAALLAVGRWRYEAAPPGSPRTRSFPISVRFRIPELPIHHAAAEELLDAFSRDDMAAALELEAVLGQFPADSRLEEGTLAWAYRSISEAEDRPPLCGLTMPRVRTSIGGADLAPAPPVR